MEYTVPSSLADLQMVLALRGEEEETEEHWPSFPSSPTTEAASTSAGSRPAYPATYSTKRSMDDTSDNDSKKLASVAKTLKHAQAFSSSENLSVLLVQGNAGASSSTLSAFAPVLTT